MILMASTRHVTHLSDSPLTGKAADRSLSCPLVYKQGFPCSVMYITVQKEKDLGVGKDCLPLSKG